MREKKDFIRQLVGDTSEIEEGISRSRVWELTASVPKENTNLQQLKSQGCILCLTQPVKINVFCILRTITIAPRIHLQKTYSGEQRS